MHIVVPTWMTATIQQQVVATHEEAAALGFRGSPTIPLDGVDPWADPDAPIGFACRIYPHRDGSDGAPTVDELRDALASAGRPERQRR